MNLINAQCDTIKFGYTHEKKNAEGNSCGVFAMKLQMIRYLNLS